MTRRSGCEQAGQQLEPPRQYAQVGGGGLGVDPGAGTGRAVDHHGQRRQNAGLDRIERVAGRGVADVRPEIMMLHSRAG